MNDKNKGVQIWVSQFIESLSAERLFNACVDAIRHKTYGIVAKESTLYQTYCLLREKQLKSITSPEKAFYMVENAIIEASACRWCEIMLKEVYDKAKPNIAEGTAPLQITRENKKIKRMQGYGRRRKNVV